MYVAAEFLDRSEAALTVNQSAWTARSLCIAGVQFGIDPDGPLPLFRVRLVQVARLVLRYANMLALARHRPSILTNICYTTIGADVFVKPAYDYYMHLTDRGCSCPGWGRKFAAVPKVVAVPAALVDLAMAMPLQDNAGLEERTLASDGFVPGHVLYAKASAKWQRYRAGLIDDDAAAVPLPSVYVWMFVAAFYLAYLYKEFDRTLEQPIINTPAVQSMATCKDGWLGIRCVQSTPGLAPTRAPARTPSPLPPHDGHEPATPPPSECK